MIQYEYKGKPVRFTVEIYHDIVPYLGGISEKAFFVDADAAIPAWQKQIDFILTEFGEYLAPRAPSAAPLSYGHLVCLGAPLRRPEDAEPNIAPAASSLEDAVAILRDARGMDFTKTPIFQAYAEQSRRIHEAFPGSAPRFAGLGLEGPITSAALFRGQDFYLDLMDDPELCAEYLSLMTESIIAFRHQSNLFSGAPAVSPSGAGLADDLASMVPPSLWNELVIPFWNQYYEGLTSGKNRSLHCEALVPAQLPYLSGAAITHYQPSVSPALTLQNVKANLPAGMPFDWLLYAYHITEMSDAQIEAWIDETLAAGVTELRTQFGRYAAEAGKLDRIHAWFAAADKYRA
ncbi:MAG: uroporphyrinogen decarboxylase family protein [Clostridiaceae bacterium]|nr:uroporphyrinogen decarboxylase family protein [Clostridiaceae bacterium]